ncbi:restriction endonuclease subunit S [Corynebacterium wankanglinii]|uniref:Restriction endonuclease subunit S n=1 Tax=Corynebacterium wankanglinii TaxID=2735136 RepID=A0A838CNE2_9CORY|nr:restriction endonuclease subunit S [Corynebacterium wankanglinii]MBA1836289.1 hypothetical protein [Corynebacterium wankanglinii]
MTNRALWTVMQETNLRAGSRSDELPLLSVSMTKGVVRFEDLHPDRVARADSFENYKTVEPGDIVLNRMSATSGAVGVAHEAGIVSPDYATFRPHDTEDSEYVSRLIGSRDFVDTKMRPLLRGIGVGSEGGVRTPRVNSSDLLGVKTWIPPLETQRRIADYLDKEISEMDALIEEFEGLISSLESRRGVYLQSKFDPAITGDASMKMGTFAQISLGKTFQGEPNEGQDNAFPVNYVRAANIQPHGQLVLDEQTMYATQDEVDKYTLNAGDVVIVEGGAGFGRSLTLQEDLPGWIFQNHVIRMVPRSGWLGEFLDYTIRAHLYSGYIELQTVGATIPGLSSERAANLPVAFIPPEEQHKRVTEAREELSRMGALIEESTRLIENLKARKTALITEVVTGRKEV